MAKQWYETNQWVMDAELILIVKDGKLCIVKNRNAITRSQVIKLLEELPIATKEKA